MTSTQEEILGFSNRWYPLAIETATSVRPPSELEIRVITAPACVLGRNRRRLLAGTQMHGIVHMEKVDCAAAADKDSWGASVRLGHS